MSLNFNFLVADCCIFFFHRHRPELSSTSWTRLPNFGICRDVPWRFLTWSGRFWIYISYIRWIIDLAANYLCFYVFKMLLFPHTVYSPVVAAGSRWGWLWHCLSGQEMDQDCTTYGLRPWQSCRLTPARALWENTLSLQSVSERSEPAGELDTCIIVTAHLVPDDAHKYNRVWFISKKNS